MQLELLWFARYLRKVKRNRKAMKKHKKNRRAIEKDRKNRKDKRRCD